MQKVRTKLKLGKKNRNYDWLCFEYLFLDIFQSFIPLYMEIGSMIFEDKRAIKSIISLLKSSNSWVAHLTYIGQFTYFFFRELWPFWFFFFKKLIRNWVSNLLNYCRKPYFMLSCLKILKWLYPIHSTHISLKTLRVNSFRVGYLWILSSSIMIFFRALTN